MPLNKLQEKKLKALGQRVKSLREAKGLTLQELAYSIGKDRQSISRLEMGKINPSYLYLTEISEGLGISIAEILSFKWNERLSRSRQLIKIETI